MAVDKVECPECGKVLRPAKPLAPGKKVRCPKCEASFVVPGADVDDEPAPKRGAAGKVTTAPKKAAPRPKAAPPPAPKAPAAGAGDDEEGGTYRFLDESAPQEEAEEDKPKIEYVPNLEVKDPRGPATAALATPANLIMLIGAVMVVAGLFGVCFCNWPFLFSQYNTGASLKEAKVRFDQQKPKEKDQQGGPKPAKKEEDSGPTDEEILEEMKKESKLQDIWEDLKDEDREWRIIWAIVSVVVIAYGAVMASASVKLVNLESYRWGMTAAIMAMGCVLALPFGMIVLTQLKRDEVKAAFEYVPE